MLKYLLPVALVLGSTSVYAAQRINSMACDGSQIDIIMEEDAAAADVSAVTYGGTTLDEDNATNDGGNVLSIGVSSCATSGSLSITISGTTYTLNLD